VKKDPITEMIQDAKKESVKQLIKDYDKESQEQLNEVVSHDIATFLLGFKKADLPLSGSILEIVAVNKYPEQYAVFKARYDFELKKLKGDK